MRGSTPGNGWNLAAPARTQGVEFDGSTAGQQGIVSPYDWSSTNPGVRDLQAQYTTNGSSWTDVGPTQIAVPNAYHQSISIDFGALSITAVNNDASFGVRLVSVYDPTLGKYSAATVTSENPVPYNNNSSNWRFDNVSVAGVAAVPEPGYIAMMLAGLGALGVRVMRRQNGAAQAWVHTLAMKSVA